MRKIRESYLERRVARDQALIEELLAALRVAERSMLPPTRGALKGYVSPELALIRAAIAKAEGRGK